MTIERTLIESQTEWESAVGYSRAVRVGPHVYVSGTTATDESGQVIGVGDPYDQTKNALEIAVDAIERAGATVDDVVRTRMYVTDIDDWAAVGSAHRECFGNVRPAATMVQVDRLIDPDHLVEVEVEAYVPDPSA